MHFVFMINQMEGGQGAKTDEKQNKTLAEILNIYPNLTPSQFV